MILSRIADKSGNNPVVACRMDNGISASALLEPKREKPERAAYTVHEVAEMLGVHYFAVYWLVQKKKLHACRAIPGKLLIPRSDVIRLLHVE